MCIQSLTLISGVVGKNTDLPEADLKILQRHFFLALVGMYVQHFTEISLTVNLESDLRHCAYNGALLQTLEVNRR